MNYTEIIKNLTKPETIDTFLTLSLIALILLIFVYYAFIYNWDKLPFIHPRKSIKGYKNSILAKSENKDCVVRAISVAFDVDYRIAHKFAKDNYNRKDKNGTDTPTYYKINDMFSDKKRTIFGKKMRKINVNTSVGNFVEKYPKGTFILSLISHTFTLKDGIVVGGNWDDAENVNKNIIRIWEII